MKILILNGPNLNMVGIREPELYGKNGYNQLVTLCKKTAKNFGVKVDIKQSNYEGDLVTLIQKARTRYDGIILNAGAYTHTSIAILDALKASELLTVEVHLTDIYKREDFRKISYVSMYAEKTIAGKGFNGYVEAIEYFASRT